MWGPKVHIPTITMIRIARPRQFTLSCRTLATSQWHRRHPSVLSQQPATLFIGGWRSNGGKRPSSRPSWWATNTPGFLSSSSSSSSSPSIRLDVRPLNYLPCVRMFSSTPSSENQSSADNNNKKDDSNNDASSAEADEEATTKAIVMTPGEQVVAATRLTMWAGVAVFAACCAYFIIKELLPTKMSPNRVFDRSFEVVRNDPDIKRRYGDALKAYGRDHGGHREGRRNFIEHTEYTNEEDGTKRTRVRYNIEGPLGRAFVFAEVSAAMPSGEFVYVLVQDKASGRVHTLIDNRTALTAARLAAGNQEAQAAMSQLLTGSGSKQ